MIGYDNQSAYIAILKFTYPDIYIKMDKTNAVPSILQTKQHFEILDGLRGVAALAVVAFHFMEWVYTPGDNFIGHGFFAFISEDHKVVLFGIRKSWRLMFRNEHCKV